MGTPEGQEVAGGGLPGQANIKQGSFETASRSAAWATSGQLMSRDPIKRACLGIADFTKRLRRSLLAIWIGTISRTDHPRRTSGARGGTSRASCGGSGRVAVSTRRRRLRRRAGARLPLRRGGTSRARCGESRSAAVSTRRRYCRGGRAQGPPLRRGACRG
jgi:hypothetical protein